MTSAPANLLAVRRLLLDHLGGHGLEPAAVGIVGDPAHRGGYHCGADRVISGDYSVVESPRDRTGLADWACALDVGAFAVSVAGKRHDLPGFSIWLVAQCKADAVDTRDIREVIYSPDGSTVRRWDRLGRRSSGDDSHRWHTHISYHRDAIRAGRDQTAVFRRYLTYIGLIEGDDMSATAEKQIADLHAALLGAGSGSYPASVVEKIKDMAWAVVKGNTSTTWLGQSMVALAAAAGVDAAELEQIKAAAREGAAAGADQIVGAVVAQLPDGSDPVSREDLVAALRSVLGSVDNPPAS